MTEHLTANLQRQSLTLLLFDKSHSKIVRNIIPIDCWEGDKGVHSLVAKVYEHIDTYQQPPGEHVYDLIPSLKIKEDLKEPLESLVMSCESAHEKSSYTLEYVLNSLETFFRRSRLQRAITDGAKLIEMGKLDELENMLIGALRSKMESFQIGTTLTDAFLQYQMKGSKSRKDQVRLGIPALDDLGLIPSRKQLWLIAAPPKSMKSWGMVHVGKNAVNDGLRVLHITLEMSEEVVALRYLQSLFNTSKKEHPIQEVRFQIDGVNNRLRAVTLPPPTSIGDSQVEEDLINRLVKHNRYGNLIIKEFPTSSLTIQALIAYLDSLESQYQFVPDVIIIDYADLMKFKASSSDSYRHEVGQIYKELRGIAVERNLIMVTASQINRAGTASQEIDVTHISEDFSKVQTADTVIIINQNKWEKQLGLSKLYVAAGRNEEDKFYVLVEQSGQTGQFALSSARLGPDLAKSLELEVEKLKAA